MFRIVKQDIAGPEAIEQDPEGSIELRQAGLGSWLALRDFQQMTKRDDLDRRIGSPSEAGKEAREEGNEGKRACARRYGVAIAKREVFRAG